MRPIGRRGWMDERRLEETLRSERPQPSDALVRRLAAELRGTRRRRLPAPRLVLAAVISSATLVALGSVGGIGAAFAAAGNAASSVAKAAGASNSAKADKITICHATASSSNPFTTITVDNNSTFEGHGAHPGDVIPAPGNGCSSPPAGGGNGGGGGGGNDDDDDETIDICHATGSATNPYVEIEVGAGGLNGHGGHAGDIIPAPAGGCPDGDTPGEDQYKPGKGCGDKNHVHFKEGECKEEEEEDE